MVPFIPPKTAISEDDKDTNENENENVAIPLLMQNALPDVEGFEKNEKLDIALRPEQVRISRMMSAVSICNK